MKRNLLNFAFRLIFSIIVLVVLFNVVDTESLVESLKKVQLFYVFLAALFYIGFIITWGLRWHLLLRDAGIDIHFIETVKTLLIGFTVALFLPSVVGSDVGRVYDMARTREQKVAIVSTVFMDRLLGLVTIVITAVVAILFTGTQFVTENIIFAIVGLAIATLIGWFVFFNKGVMQSFRWVLRLPLVNRFESTLVELYQIAHKFQQNPRSFATLMSVSILSAVLEVMSVVMLTYALGVTISPVYHFIFVPIIWVILVAPISIGGLGVRETAFAFFFTQAGMVTSDAVVLSFLYYFLSVAAGIVGGIITTLSYLVSSKASQTDIETVPEILSE